MIMTYEFDYPLQEDFKKPYEKNVSSEVIWSCKS